MNFVGIDPGQSGGIACISEAGEVWAFKMGETERDTWMILCRNTIMDFALIESVHSMPKQGVASSFKFGRNYGFLRGCLIALAIPFDEVTPQKWQKAMGCLTHGDKNVSKAKAQQLFPQIKVNHAIADALLIAEYCRRVYGKKEIPSEMHLDFVPGRRI